MRLFCIKILTLLTLLSVFVPGLVQAATVPANFGDALVTSGLTNAAAMDIAPDGRIFVAEQKGTIRVIKNGVLLSAPFMSLDINFDLSRGLIGITLDPNFSSNRLIYVYYTSPQTGSNRVSRFRALASNPDVVDTSYSEQVIIDFGVDATETLNGGGLRFGTDGKLYIGVGDGISTSGAQSLSDIRGKILRLNPNLSAPFIPSDNPYFTSPIPGVRKEIWAFGVRHPFSISSDSATGKLYFNESGENSWEEVNQIQSKANYGWPTCEGNCGNVEITKPVYSYDRSQGCGLTGGTFYTATQFGSAYLGDYFIADFCNSWIKRFQSSGAVQNFATEVGEVVDMKVGPNGALYYLSRTGVRRIRNGFSGNANPIAFIFSAFPPGAQNGLDIQLSGAGSSDPDGDELTYSWDFGDGSPAQSGVAVTHHYSAGGSYDVRLTVRDAFGGIGTSTNRFAMNTPPTPSILTPVLNSNYSAGETISFSGSAVDIEDGTLPASVFSWTFTFHKGATSTNFSTPKTGVRSGTIVIPQTGDTATDVFYRIHLTVTDSKGTRTEVTRDISPRIANITVTSNPVGLKISIDGAVGIGPTTVSSIVGSQRQISAAASQLLSGQTYDFESWSDAGAMTHNIQVPADGGTYIAKYKLHTTIPRAPMNLVAD